MFDEAQSNHQVDACLQPAVWYQKLQGMLFTLNTSKFVLCICRFFVLNHPELNLISFQLNTSPFNFLVAAIGWLYALSGKFHHLNVTLFCLIPSSFLLRRFGYWPEFNHVILASILNFLWLLSTSFHSSSISYHIFTF